MIKIEYSTGLGFIPDVINVDTKDRPVEITLPPVFSGQNTLKTTINTFGVNTLTLKVNNSTQSINGSSEFISKISGATLELNFNPFDNAVTLQEILPVVEPSKPVVEVVKPVVEVVKPVVEVVKPVVEVVKPVVETTS